MKILIVGSDLNTFLTAKYIKQQENEHDIYITTDIECNDGSYTPINIKENDIELIYDFVKYNQIEFTVVTSELAIINGISDEFSREGLRIAAPFSEAARVTFFNSIAKKVMYKLKINTPRFGIFDRENIAADYIRRAKFPIIIKNDFTLSQRDYKIYTNYSKAKIALQKIFENENEKIVIENYIDSNPIYLYFITDGYNALPLISVERKEYDNFVQIKAPCEKINDELLINILNRAVFPLLDDIVKYAGSYSGILGMKIKLVNNNFFVLEYYNKFQSHDLQAFLSLLNEDLAQVFKDAANKKLGKRNLIETDSKYSYTLAINKNFIKHDVDEDDYFVSEDNSSIIITKTASTMNYAKKELEEYLEFLCEKETFEKIKANTKEAIRI